MAARILVAPDSFKGTFPAWEVAAACAEGSRSAAATRILPGGRRRRGHDADPRRRARRSSRAARGNRSARSPDRGGAWDRPARRNRRGRGGLRACAARALRARPRASHDDRNRRADRRRAGAGASRILVAAGGSATVDGGADAIEVIRTAGGLGSPGSRCCATSRRRSRTRPASTGRRRARPRMRCGGSRRGSSGWRQSSRATPGSANDRRRGRACGRAVGQARRRASPRRRSCSTRSISTGGSTARTRPSSGTVSTRPGFAGKAVGRIAARCRRAGVPVHAIVGSSALDGTDVANLGLASVRLASDPDELLDAAPGVGDRRRRSSYRLIS